jgi:hypothetical protein
MAVVGQDALDPDAVLGPRTRPRPARGRRTSARRPGPLAPRSRRSGCGRRPPRAGAASRHGANGVGRRAGPPCRGGGSAPGAWCRCVRALRGGRARSGSPRACRAGCAARPRPEPAPCRRSMPGCRGSHPSAGVRSDLPCGQRGSAPRARPGCGEAADEGRGADRASPPSRPPGDGQADGRPSRDGRPSSTRPARRSSPAAAPWRRSRSGSPS